MAPDLEKSLGLGTTLIHADDTPGEMGIAPGISMTTTFRHVEGIPLVDATENMQDPSRHVYSRYTTPNSVRLEKVLSTILHGHAITYRSGLAAATAALLHYQPRRVAFTKGYKGVHHILEIYGRSRTDLQVIDLDDEYQAGDLAWVETPLNPTGDARDIQHYANKVHAVGGKLVVDATFGPPPLQDPFAFGADCVLHSGTKYLGGHSDLLAGVLVVKTEQEWRKLLEDRVNLGNVMGSMESWLLLRSLRTLHLRIPRQAASATELAQWLDGLAHVPAGQVSSDGVPGGIVAKVHHTSLQEVGGFDPKVQMAGGFSPTFAIICHDVKHAETLPFRTKLFTPATSLGGAESLLEQRLASDPKEDPRLVRLSVGLEDVEDLKDDLRQALKGLAQ
ncbi:hypothetical protein FRB99_004560 [Tulasnella sp. 403]|nr:hypothetical protein FRB99_004560 [Tulasnella sp. 403]